MERIKFKKFPYPMGNHECHHTGDVNQQMMAQPSSVMRKNWIWILIGPTDEAVMYGISDRITYPHINSALKNCAAGVPAALRARPRSS